MPLPISPPKPPAIPPTLSAFALSLETSRLARELQRIFLEVKNDGRLEVYINDRSEILWCLPHRALKKHVPDLELNTLSMKEVQDAIQPYHGILFLESQKNLLDHIPLGTSSAHNKFIAQANPTKNIRQLADDLKQPYEYVLNMVKNYMDWGKLIPIYPVSKHCYYVNSHYYPGNQFTNPDLKEEFAECFPGGHKLEDEFVRFNQPWSLGFMPNLAAKAEVELQTRKVIWMLKKFLLIQVHDYFTLALDERIRTQSLPNPFREPDYYRIIREMEEKGDFEDDSEDKSFEDESNDAVSGRKLERKLRHMFREHEVEQILSVNRDVKDLEKLIMMLPYISSEFHLEAIAFHSGLSRKEAFTTMDKYLPLVHRMRREDINMTKYYRTPLNDANGKKKKN